MKTTDKPILQNFHLEGVGHILPEDACEAHKSNRAVLIDVREEYEWETERIDGVLFHPMQQIAQWLPTLHRNQNIIVYCHKGIRSTHVAQFLKNQGFPYALNMDGGISAWKARGLPVTKPLEHS
ncbi:MAG: rhodanese-like domain-containing protein [Mariniphaga sp.]